MAAQGTVSEVTTTGFLSRSLVFVAHTQVCQRAVPLTLGHGVAPWFLSVCFLMTAHSLKMGLVSHQSFLLITKLQAVPLEFIEILQCCRLPRMDVLDAADVKERRWGRRQCKASANAIC